MVRGSNTRVQSSLLVRANRVGKLCAHRNGQASKTRKFVVANGFGQDHNLGVYNNNVDTVERAFVERYFLCKEGGGFRPALPVSPNEFHESGLAKFRKELLSVVHVPPRASRQQVVDAYTGRKRIIYGKAYESLCKDPVKQDDARLTSFVKFEKQDIGKAPRVINPRSPRYNLELARYLKFAEKKIFTAINKVFGARTPMTVIKGVNADRAAQVVRAKWDCFRVPVAVGLDASKFDMHVSVPALRYEHSFYTSMYNGQQDLKRLLSWQLRNTGRAYVSDGHVDFDMAGTRSSGDINTSLGNCIIMCALVYAYARSRGVKIELCNNGDDCVVIMEACDLKRFLLGLDGWFRKKGFAMVAEPPVYEFEQIEFCQTHPVHLSTGYRMIRNHNTVLQKDPMCLVAIPNQKAYQRWCAAVGKCGEMLNQGVPVQHQFARVFSRNGTETSDAHMEHVYSGRYVLRAAEGCKNAVVDARARVSYYYAFGVRPDEQLSAESMLDSMDFTRFDGGEEIEREDLHIDGPRTLGA